MAHGTQGSRGRIFPWPIWPALTTWPVVSTPGPHPQWVRARSLTQGLGQGAGGSGDPWPLGWTLWQGVQKALLSVVGGLTGKGGDHGPRQNRSRGNGWARRKVLESGLGGEGPPLSVSPSYTQAQAMPWEQWACLLEPWAARSPPPLMRQGMHWPGEEGALLGGLAVPQHFTWA